MFVRGRLSATAGVDFEALRDKYKDKSASAKASVASTPEATAEQAQIRADYEKLKNLDSIRACHVCHGSGIEKYQYNFQEKDRNCENCDGEGLVRRLEIKSVLTGDGAAAPSADLTTVAGGSSEGAGADVASSVSVVTSRDDGVGDDDDDADKPPMLL
jgi:hypothetical protein